MVAVAIIATFAIVAFLIGKLSRKKIIKNKFTREKYINVNIL